MFGILNAFAGRLVLVHVAVRSAFGIGEAGNFPASIKTVAEWFPKRERALATAIFNSGSNFGAMVAALFVPWCMIHFGDQQGWKMAFILTGASGFLWLIFLVLTLRHASQEKSGFQKPNTITSTSTTKAAADSSNGDKGKSLMAQALWLSPDHGVCRRQVHDRWRLVVLSVLVAGLPE